MASHGPLLIVIGINFFLLIVILVLFLLAMNVRSTLNSCQTKESPWCYSIQCPGDDSSQGPCFGYAQRTGSQPNSFNCSSASSTDVDKDGNPL